MLLQKTERACIDLRSGVRTLGPREHSLLLLCDDKSFTDLSSTFDGEGEKIVLDLVRLGYLEPVISGLQSARPLRAAPAAGSAPASPATPGRHLP